MMMLREAVSLPSREETEMKRFTITTDTENGALRTWNFDSFDETRAFVETTEIGKELPHFEVHEYESNENGEMVEVKVHSYVKIILVD